MDTEPKDYVHQPLDEEVTAVAGHYVLVKQARLPFRGQEVLYLVGHAAFDACCGVGGCAYGLVPGFVLDWQYKENAQGLPVSRVAPIRDWGIQREVRRLIEERETVNQVRFQ